uniref:ribosomal protein S11 n=1 Tax=Corydalis crispa TaxID=2922752 RepID=UPI00218222F2|nr:ribosomal protein S11 [Corydalis crispa]UVH68268.1 ribosomal protein S11 [Corydalis crispa]
MAKPILIRPRVSLRRRGRPSSRRSGRLGSRKNVRRIPKGVIHVQAGLNNTIVTVTDVRGQVVSWASAGTCGFKTARKATPFAAQTAAGNALRIVQGMQQAEVKIKGPGLGRDAALRAIFRRGIRINLVHDVTPLPYNGCRPPKKRRV